MSHAYGREGLAEGHAPGSPSTHDTFKMFMCSVGHAWRKEKATGRGESFLAYSPELECISAWLHQAPGYRLSWEHFPSHRLALFYFQAKWPREMEQDAGPMAGSVEQ